MKRAMIEIVWGIFNLFFLLCSFILIAVKSWVAASVGIALFFLIVVWRFFLYAKRKAIKERQIPQDLIDDLNYAEKRYLDSNGREEPQKILWDIAKLKNERRYNLDGKQRTGKEESGTGISTIPKQPIRRENIQDSFVSNTSKDRVSDGKVRTNNHKGLFGRR